MNVKSSPETKNLIQYHPNIIFDKCLSLVSINTCLFYIPLKINILCSSLLFEIKVDYRLGTSNFVLHLQLTPYQ